MTDRPTDGSVRSVRRMLAIVVSMAKTRLSLLAVAARLELNSICILPALTVRALIFVAMLFLMFSLLVITAYWETSRLLAIGSLLSLCLTAATVPLLILRHKAKSASSLFAASLSDLSKDHSELADMFDDTADVARRSDGQN